jgi:hypothetical protein
VESFQRNPMKNVTVVKTYLSSFFVITFNRNSSLFLIIGLNYVLWSMCGTAAIVCWDSNFYAILRMLSVREIEQIALLVTWLRVRSIKFELNWVWLCKACMVKHSLMLTVIIIQIFDLNQPLRFITPYFWIFILRWTLISLLVNFIVYFKSFRVTALMLA